MFAELEREGIETKLVELSGKRIHGCTACYRCFANKDRRCAVKEDAANDCIGEMIIPGSIYWNIGVGREIGEVEKDEEGVSTMRTLGRNMAWLLKALKEARGAA